MFLALALAALGSSEAYVLAWYGCLVALCLAIVLLREPGPATGLTPLATGVVLLGAWIAATNQWANPSYTVMAPFHAALLVGGFALGRAAARTELVLPFRVGLVFALILALWALTLQFGRAEARAHALFITPATFGAVINLLYVPALVVACKRPSYALLAAVFVLSAAIAAAQSRGALIATGGALLIVAALVSRLPLALERAAVARTFGVAALGFATWWVASRTGLEERSFLDLAGPSWRERLSLYFLAWEGIRQSSWLVGAGYQAFYYLLEAASAQAQYANRSTYFVHDDYLQALFELGLPGLVALAFVAFAPLAFAARKARNSLTDGEAVSLAAVTGAIATVSLHAVVDFPFYIPVCALLFGALAGTADVLLVRAGKEPAWTLSISPLVRRATVAGLVTVIAWALTLPAAAEAAANRAFAQWREGDAQNAAFWFEAARRLNPRDWRFHWYAGQFWLAQAEASRLSDIASRADRAFAAAVAANPREGHSLLGRLVTQMRLRAVLTQPVDAATLLAWAEQVVRLSPRSPSVLAESERVRQHFGSQR